VVVAPVANALEYRDAILAATDRLAIDDARAGAKAPDSLNNQLEAPGEVAAGAAVLAYAAICLAGDEPDAVVLYLV
jgi:hypothetical protein